MVISLPNPKPDHRSATKEVSRIISSIQQSKRSSLVAKSNFGKMTTESFKNNIVKNPANQYLIKTSKSPPGSLMQVKDVPPLGRTMAMHEEDCKWQEGSVYSGDFKTVDPGLLREIALENTKCASSQSGLFVKTESRNQPGGCNITHLKSANGDQGTFINSAVGVEPINVPPQNNQHLYIRYTAPTFSSDVIGRQGASFVQPEDSSYNSQFKFFSVDPEAKARPLSIYKQCQRNCPNAKGASNIMMHNGQFMRVFDNAPQSAPVNPFDTRVSKAGCRSSLLNIKQSVEQKLNSPLLKMSSKENANAITASEAATDAYRREQKINTQEYLQNKTSGWRWAAGEKMSVS